MGHIAIIDTTYRRHLFIIVAIGRSSFTAHATQLGARTADCVGVVAIRRITRTRNTTYIFTVRTIHKTGIIAVARVIVAANTSHIMVGSAIARKRCHYTLIIAITCRTVISVDAANVNRSTRTRYISNVIT